MRLSPPLTLIFAALLAPNSSPSQKQPAAGPPAAKVESVSTNYFGVTVADPYRWMEAGTADPQFLAFLHAQND